MGLYTTAAAVGLGYTLGRPGGRAQLEQYMRRARELAGRPEVTRLRERGWDVAGEQVASVKRRLDARTRAAALDPAGADPAGADHDGPQDRRGWGRLSSGRAGRRRSRGGTGVVAADVMPDTHELPGTDPAVTPTPLFPAMDPGTVGFGGTSIEDDSRAALGFPTLPPTGRPDTAGPASDGP